MVQGSEIVHANYKMMHDRIARGRILEVKVQRIGVWELKKTICRCKQKCISGVETYCKVVFGPGSRSMLVWAMSW